jgi:serine/threonine protein phosphatase PrpC
LQTLPHSPVGYAVEAGILDVRRALHHEDRHLVSNLLGAPDMRIDVGPRVRLRQRDTVVLGSDGLFDNLHVSEVVEIVRGGPLEPTAADLAGRCRARMTANGNAPCHPDDLTFALFRRGAESPS